MLTVPIGTDLPVIKVITDTMKPVAETTTRSAVVSS